MAFAGKVIPVKGTVFLVSENSVSIAVSQLKIFFGGMTRGHEQIGFAFVQFLDEESSRVLRQPDGLASSLCFLATPCPLRSSQNHFPLSQRSKAISVHASEFRMVKGFFVRAMARAFSASCPERIPQKKSV